MPKEWGAFVAKDLVLEPTGSGKLQGAAFAVKDVFAIKNYTSGAGNPDWLNSHSPSKQTAEAIQRLLFQGARLTGTTQTDEIMYSLNGENFHYGTPVNPQAPECIPGGSSSGSAVAVSAGLVDFALGTDTGGSVRIPAAYCGIYGFRPTHGLVALNGVIPLAESFDTVGWMARVPKQLLDVGLALLDEPTPNDKGFKRMFIGNDAWALADVDCMASGLEIFPVIERMIGHCEWVDLAPQGLAAWMNAFRTLQGLEIWRAHGEWIQTVKPTFGPGIAERFAWASTLREEDSAAASELRKEVRKRMSDLLGEDGLLIIPTAPGSPPLLKQSGEAVENRRTRTLQLSCIAGLAGLPQITIPLTTSNGMPMGISIIAGHGQDLKLLRWVNAAAFEF
ncbi:amidase [Paenibacillus psychroresistens]|uniref:Amidase n=1 Tax=Paenibacillus psychroresistens TaxID=1778678 RepID=A0A6B8RS98_9BACL|nr:amidase [Paenibacillus psychroresistens]QGQ98333.1 amidase [Paenibacillus psychroresistens]